MTRLFLKRGLTLFASPGEGQTPFQTEPTRRRLNRVGGTMPDLIVAAVLTMTLIGTLTTFTVRSGRLIAETRRHQFAVDELTNQLERLQALDSETLDAAIATVAPSEEASVTLPAAVISAEKIDDSLGERIVLSLNWERGAVATPIRLVGWIKPASTESSP